MISNQLRKNSKIYFMFNKEKIVIVGYGWVGQANSLALVRMGYPVFYYDVTPPIFRYQKYQDLYRQVSVLNNPLAEDGESTWYIVSVGDRVRENGEQDISLIKNALAALKSIKGKIILRSTVLPQSLKDLPFDYYLPEFLHENHAVDECLNPFYFVIGKRNQFLAEPEFLKEWSLRAKKVFYGTPEQAAYVKYLSNIWNAVRIAFVNEFGSLIREPNTSEDVKEIEKVIDFVLEKRHYLRYGRSFGGHCLPKDLKAFYAAHKSFGKNPVMLEAAFLSNLVQKDREMSRNHLPEWFSSWSDEYRYLNHLTWKKFLWHKFNSLVAVRETRKRLRFITAALAKIIPDRTLEEVREIWDKKARENARYYVNTKTALSKDVNEFDLRESGNYDYERYVAGDPVLVSILNDPVKDRVLEVGCGIGRMTEFFPKHFKKVSGVDISEVMLESAKKRLAHLPEVELKLSNGKTLDFPDNSFHLVFSYQTLQHVSTKELLLQNLKEIHRTLKPGGVAKLHLRTGRGPYKWHWASGVSVDPATAKSMSEAAGFKFVKHEIEDPKSLWVWLEKPKTLV